MNDPVKNDTRPVNVGIADLLLFKWPVAALASITHRVTGLALFVGIGFALYALDMSLGSEYGFQSIKAMMASPLGKFIAWGLLSALAYHFVAGVKHLCMDAGLGETLAGGRLAALLTICLSIILAALLAIWIFI